MGRALTLSALADLILGRCCCSCGDPGTILCRWCAEALAPWPAPVPGLPAVSAFDYEGVVRDVLIAFKEHGVRELARPLAMGLAQSITVTLQAHACHHTTAIALVPVPARPGRDFDHSAHLATLARDQLARRDLQIDVFTVLTRQNHTEMKHLGRSQRKQAAQGSFTLKATSRTLKALQRRLVIVTDDIITSGATSTEAMRVLGASGLSPLGIAAAARTPPPRRQPGYVGLVPRSRSTQTPPSFS